MFPLLQSGVIPSLRYRNSERKHSIRTLGGEREEEERIYNIIIVYDPSEGDEKFGEDDEDDNLPLGFLITRSIRDFAYALTR